MSIFRACGAQGVRDVPGKRQSRFPGTSLTQKVRYTSRERHTPYSKDKCKEPRLAACLELEGFHCLEHFVGVIVGLYLGPDLANDAFFIDQEGGALDTHIFLAIHALLFIDVIALGDLGLGVGEQREGQAELLSKLLV